VCCSRTGRNQKSSHSNSTTLRLCRAKTPIFVEWESQGRCGTPLMFAVYFLPADAVSTLFQANCRNRILRQWVDMPDPKDHITPLMAVAFREDQDGVKIAKLLLDEGGPGGHARQRSWFNTFNDGGAKRKGGTP
jgi:hypothetical protein